MHAVFLCLATGGSTDLRPPIRTSALRTNHATRLSRRGDGCRRAQGPVGTDAQHVLDSRLPAEVLLLSEVR